MRKILLGLGCLSLLLWAGCKDKGSQEPAAVATPDPLVESHQRMLTELKKIAVIDAAENWYYSDKKYKKYEQGVINARNAGDMSATAELQARLGQAYLDYGMIEEAIENMTAAYDYFSKQENLEMTMGEIAFTLGVAHLRRGETENCCANHTPSSCIIPMQQEAFHTRREGSETAVKYFLEAITTKETQQRTKYKSTWLMNLAHMTLGEYPEKVPEGYRVPTFVFESKKPFPRFKNVSGELGMDSDGMSGGVAIGDMDGDGDFDIVVSCWDMAVEMRYFENRGKEGFLERSEEAGFKGMTGGLNIVPADYDNDGDLDLYVLRGAWLWEMGKRPNSLLQNQGDGTFLDATFLAGLGNENFPSQTAGWADYDNDGDLDLFVGNEHDDGNLQAAGWAGGGEEVHAPSQLFRNNGDGTFEDVATQAGVTNLRFAKGCAWGDVNDDRWPDLIVSNMSAENRLYLNQKDGTFLDVARQAGILEPTASFPAWVWDFDNDGFRDACRHGAKVSDPFRALSGER